MRQVQSKTLLRDIKQANGNWFSPQNKRFFGDRAYYGYYGQTTGKAYLVQNTDTWSDMLGGQKIYCYKIHELDQDTLKISNLLDDTFPTMNDVKAWLKTH